MSSQPQDTFERPLSAGRWSQSLEFFFVLAVIAAATVIRLWIDPALEDQLAYITYFGAIFIIVWRTRLSMSILGLLLSWWIADFYFISPRLELKSPIDNAGHLVGTMMFLSIGGAIILITQEMRVAQRRVADQAERLRTTLSSIGDAVIATDRKGRVLQMNPVAEVMTGWKIFDAVGQPLEAVFRIINEQSREAVENPASRALREGAIVGLANHTLLLAKDGVAHPIDDSAAPIRSKDGQIVGCVLVFRDVAQRRHAERTLRESEARQRAMFEVAMDCVVSMDHLGRVIEFNAAAASTFGYARDEVVGRELAELIIPPALRQAHRNGMTRYLATGEAVVLNHRLELSAMRSDGSEFPVELTVTRIPLDGPPQFTAYLRDITERKRWEQEQADIAKGKDEFLALLGHELRNPLAPIANVARFLHHACSDRPDVQQAVQTLLRQSEHMSRLVDDLLEASRVSRGKVKLQLQRIDMGSIIRHAFDTTRPLCEESGHAPMLELPETPIFVDADPVRMAQVISNLLSNACKYTDRGDTIRVVAALEGDHAVVRVQDTGIGIAADQFPRIFEMFSQVSHATDRSHGGLGIGLALARLLVEMHGGTIEVNSEGLGRGSEFIVRIPVAAAAPQTALAPPSDAVCAPALSRTTLRRVLVVDDNRDAAESLATLLRLSGHEVMTAHDGEAAITATAHMQPDVVVLDIGLPGIDGYEAARRIRAQPNGAAITLIAMTGWGQEEDRRRSLEAGFNAHLVKPADLERLLHLLAHAPESVGVQR